MERHRPVFMPGPCLKKRPPPVAFFLLVPAFCRRTPSYLQTPFKMKLRHAMIGLVLAMAAGCDKMEQDIDGQMLSINDDPAYLLPDANGYIDLPSRIISPGKIRVEITGTTRNGELTDLGKGLLQYVRFKGNSTGKDAFSFRVFSDGNKILGEDTIDIITPADTTSLPCKYVYTRGDSARGVTGPITVDVAANDYSCSGSLTITVNVAPQHGTASVVGNKIHYVPGPSFAGHDNLLYKAANADPSVIPGYAMLWIVGTDTTSTPGPGPVPGCLPKAIADLFSKPLNDTTTMFLDVLANDIKCDSVVTLQVLPGLGPHRGTAWVDNVSNKIAYKNFANVNIADTLWYEFGGQHGGGVARVIIKRQ